jgi:hypothetical protein
MLLRAKDQNTDNEHAGFAISIHFVRAIDLALCEFGVGYAVGSLEVVVEFIKEVGDCLLVGSVVCRLSVAVSHDHSGSTNQ